MEARSSQVPLTGAERRALKKAAHTYKPVLRVGRRGLHDEALELARQALADEELIKVHIRSDARKELAEQLAAACGAHLVGMVGHHALLYRPESEGAQERRSSAAQRSDDQEHLSRTDQGTEDRASELDEA